MPRQYGRLSFEYASSDSIFITRSLRDSGLCDLKEAIDAVRRHELDVLEERLPFARIVLMDAKAHSVKTEIGTRSNFDEKADCVLRMARCFQRLVPLTKMTETEKLVYAELATQCEKLGNLLEAER